MAPSQAGHVFVVKADITALDCDAWLCPTDNWFEITAGFGRPVGKPEGGILAGYRWHASEWAQPFAPSEDGRPIIVLGRVGRAPATNPEEVSALVNALLPVIDAFVDVAIEHCAELEGRLLRFALPVIGTGDGGLRGAKGDVIRPLLAHLNELARNRGIDLILCTDNALTWSAVQSARTDDEWRLTSSED